METKITDDGIYTGTLMTEQIVTRSFDGFIEIKKLADLRPTSIDNKGIYTGSIINYRE